MWSSALWMDILGCTRGSSWNISIYLWFLTEDPMWPSAWRICLCHQDQPFPQTEQIQLTLKLLLFAVSHDGQEPKAGWGFPNHPSNTLKTLTAGSDRECLYAVILVSETDLKERSQLWSFWGREIKAPLPLWLDILRPECNFSGCHRHLSPQKN